MPLITDFARSGMWDYRNVITPAAAYAPLAVEGAILAKNIYQKPQVIREKLSLAKKKVVQLFTRQVGETKQEAILRIAKNVFIACIALGLMGGAAYASIVLLPGSLAVSTAISIIFLIGKFFLNAKSYQKQLISLFSIKAGEEPEEARKRIRKNILKLVAITIVASVAIFLGVYFVAIPLSHGFTWQLTLPLQTKGVVFAEYALIGAFNGGMAYHKWKKGDKWGALYHLFVGALSFIFPSFYWNHDMRLHHSFYGLLLMSSPYRPLRMLGGAVTFDAALYMLEPLRGYQGAHAFHQYDFINTIVDHPATYANGYASSLILENINKNWKEENAYTPLLEEASS